MKTVIEMAREAGLFTHKEVQPEIERFAELVRADAIANEREACARVCDRKAEVMAITGKSCDPDDLASAIRARSNA